MTVDLSSPEVQEKIAQLQERLGISPEAQAQVDADTLAMADEEVQQEIKGSDVNWDDEYELDPSIAHHYPKATFKKAGDEFRWVVQINEFKSETKPFLGRGVNKIGEPSGLGEFLTWLTNGPEGWRVAQIFPNGSGQAAVLFQRVVSVALPDPLPIKTSTEVTPITDEELIETESSALEWLGEGDGQQASNGETSE